MRRFLLSLLSCFLLPLTTMQAESCTTQSQMTLKERDTLARVGTSFAGLIAANNIEAVRAQTIPQFAQNFAGIEGAIHTAAQHVDGASFVPDTLWILDASALKTGTDGGPQDAQFFCSLNRSVSQTSFLIPALPAGRYALVILDAVGISEPWQIAMLLRQSGPDTWQMGGLFPRATVAAGHDGVWYWRTARDYAGKRQAWNSFVYYTEAEHLLKPVDFLSSTNLEALQAERTKAAPAALSGGLGSDQPLVISAGKGPEVRVTSLAAENAPDRSGSLDLLAHVRVADALADPVASRARNAAAAKAIVAAYPELRSAFHGVWIVADLPGGGTYISEEPMASL